MSEEEYYMIIYVTKDSEISELIVRIESESKNHPYVVYRCKELTDKNHCFSFQIPDIAFAEINDLIKFNE